MGRHAVVELDPPTEQILVQPLTETAQEKPLLPVWFLAGLLGTVGLTVVVALVVLVAGGLGSGSARTVSAGTSTSGAATLTITGAARVISTGSPMSSGQVCSGRGAYGDMRAGQKVTVYDGSGSVIGSGTLEEGESRTRPGGPDLYADSCAFDFTITGVPDGEQQYGIRIGTRSIVEFTPAKVRDDPEVWMGS